MAGLSVGTIPQFYKDVYDVLCPGSSSSKVSSKVDKQVWRCCMKTASLPEQVIQQIWEQCDPSGSGSLGRDSLYRSLALAALAQQGKQVDEKSLQHIGDSELPQPKLATLSELRKKCMEVVRATRPTQLGYTYEELRAMDDISVSVIPEKKGTVFKHLEYLVKSTKKGSTVHRRYKDFEALYEVLASKYPYRLVPRMPPKKFTPSDAFIEQRRRALRRFMLLVVRHPVFTREEALHFFLTAGGSDVGTKLKDKYKSSSDEFQLNPHARNAQSLVSEDTRLKYDRLQEQIGVIHQVISSMLQMAHNIENRSTGLESDMKQLATNMSTLATHSLLMSDWTSGSDESWNYMQRDFNTMSGKFSAIADRAHKQGVRETRGFTERVSFFLDLVNSYQDLCDRRELVQRKHQKALDKVKTMVNYKERIESTGGHISQKDDSRIIRRDDDLILLEKRNFFSLFCLDLEAQLVHVNLTQLTELFEELVSAQFKGHTDYVTLWEEVKVVVDGIGVTKKSNPSSPISISPTGSGEYHLNTSPRRPAETTRSPFL